MEEKQLNKNKGGLNPLMYTALLLVGMMAVGFASFYIPIMIFALLIFVPFALDIDMKQARPILSLGLLAISAISLYFNQFNFALYIILAISSGMSAVVCYIVWRFLNIKSFVDGLMYSVFSTVLVGIITALIIFIIRDRQPFAEEIVLALEKWMRGANVVDIEYLYRYYLMGTSLTLAESQNALLGSIEGVTAEQMINAIMPFMQSGVNQFSLSAMVLYPTFTGVITWWRGNARFYKKQPMDEDNKELKPKPFSTFAMPRWLFTSVAFMLLISFLVMISDYGEVMFNAAVLMQNIAYILLIIQGLAVFEYFLKRNKIFKHTVFRVITISFIMIITAGILPMFVGGIDMFINIRVAYAKAKEIKKQMQQNAMRAANSEKEKDEDVDDKKSN